MSATIGYLTGSIQGCVGVSTNGNGFEVQFADGTSRQASAAEILAATKAARIAEINAECERRITSVWPLPRQNSAILGIYGQATLDAMTTFIDGHIAASNTACDSVDAAQTLAEVEAVTVAWPV